MKIWSYICIVSRFTVQMCLDLKEEKYQNKKLDEMKYSKDSVECTVDFSLYMIIH